MGTHYLPEGQTAFFILLLLNLIFCIFMPFEFHCISLLPQSKFLLSRLSLAQHTYYLFATDTAVPIFLRLLLVLQLRGLYYGRHSCCHIGDRNEFGVSVFERNILEVWGCYFVTVRLNIQIKTRTIFKPLSYFSRTLGQRTYITEYLGFKFRFHSQKKKKKRKAGMNPRS